MTTPIVVGPEGFNVFGADGYNAYGYNKKGMDRTGYRPRIIRAMYPTWSAHDGYDYEDILSCQEELSTYDIPNDKLQKFIYPKMPSYVVLIYASDTPNVENLIDSSPNFGLWTGDKYWDSNHPNSSYVVDD